MNKIRQTDRQIYQKMNPAKGADQHLTLYENKYTDIMFLRPFSYSKNIVNYKTQKNAEECECGVCVW